jgi:phage gp37-like protein
VTAAVAASTPWFGPERTMIEQAVRLLLDRYLVKNGGYLRSVEFYNGELDTDAAAGALIEQLLAGAPAILIGTGQAVYRRRSTSSKIYEVQQQIEILHGSAHLRSPASRLHGDVSTGQDDSDPETLPAYDPGIYRMMRDVRDEILGRPSYLSTLGTVMINREDVVLQAPGLTLWRQVFGVEYRWRLAPRPDRVPTTVGAIEVRGNVSTDEDDHEHANPITVSEAP